MIKKLNYDFKLNPGFKLGFGFKLNSGFSLIELLVVLLLIALGLLALTPNLSEFFARRQTQAYAVALAQSLRLARAKAIELQTLVAVCAAKAENLKLIERRCQPYSALGDWSAWLVVANYAGAAAENLQYTGDIKPEYVRLLLDKTANSNTTNITNTDLTANISSSEITFTGTTLADTNTSVVFNELGLVLGGRRQWQICQLGRNKRAKLVTVELNGLVVVTDAQCLAYK